MAPSESQAPAGKRRRRRRRPLRKPVAFPAPGGMDGAKGTVVAGLYDELMVEILSRVPVKDLRRSTCVSKPWRDLITDPLNRKKLPQTLEGFFHGDGGGHHSYGCFTTLSASGESAPPVDPSFSFLTGKLPGVERLVLLNSYNGLLLFGCTREGVFGYIVCNPATEELVTVPASSASCPPPPPFEEGYDGDVNDGGKRYAYTFLMFDPAVSSQFQLIQIWENRSMMEVEMVHFYSSKTQAWSDRSSKWKQGEKCGEWGLWGKAIVKLMHGWALVNGLLHFMVYDVQKREHLIVAVDGEGKTCSIIGLHDKDVAAIAFIGQSQDHLRCVGVNRQYQRQQGFLRMDFTQLSFWVLEDYDTQQWILKHNVSCSQIFGLPSRKLIDFDIVAIHPNHNSIILAQHWDQKLVSYNMDTKELRALCTLGEGYRFLTPYVPWFMESSALTKKD